MAIIGIDLGTSSSAAEVLRGGRPVIIPSAEGVSLGGKPGDLFVVVRSAPHAHFVRAGPDLWRTEIVEVADAVLGATPLVPTLDGEAVAVTLAPGTQPDTVLRLRGKGLPEFGGRGRGDLLLRIKVRIPERPSADERRLYQQLKALGPAGKDGRNIR